MPVRRCTAGALAAPVVVALLLASSPAAAAGPQQAPPQGQAPGAPATPDKTAFPWSRTAVPLLGIGEVQAGEAAGGAAWRIGTSRGAVLVWRPAGYHSRDAGVVVYLHGYFTTTDQAVADHKLLEQFRASGRNALFVVPESPAWNGEDSVWTAPGPLLDEVYRRTGLTPPRGPLVVAAHSGGFRPLLLWLADPRLEEVLLLDGLYRSEEQFRAWLEGSAARRLVLVGDETAQKAEALAAAVPGAVVLPRVPPSRPGLEGTARTTRLLSIRSQYNHMAIVEAGEVLPLLLRASRLPQVH
ncbi:MAG TPA: hypothetical protein VFP50_10620 [Anaeromyxobacteraceae bacterium]|nr:hypothetical protein [Anaeromyxobacteraceae bacterium]